MMSLKGYRKVIDRLLGEYSHINYQIDKERDLLIEAEDHLLSCEQALDIIQQVAQSIQQQTHKRISYVVTRCLAAVFPQDPYRFKIIFERKRSQTEARMVFLRKKDKVWREIRPKDASGGGCIDVASLALRLACLVLSRPKVRRLIIMDEPFKNISPEYRDLIPDMLKVLTKEMNLQLVMVTNFPEYEVGSVFRV